MPLWRITEDDLLVLKCALNWIIDSHGCGTFRIASFSFPRGTFQKCVNENFSQWAWIRRWNQPISAQMHMCRIMSISTTKPPFFFATSPKGVHSNIVPSWSILLLGNLTESSKNGGWIRDLRFPGRNCPVDESDHQHFLLEQGDFPQRVDL